MERRGDKAKITTFIQSSSIITENTPILGLYRTQTDDEVRTYVTLRVMPLHWMNTEDGSMDKMFDFLRNNHNQLHGTQLLDALFLAFWTNQQKIIFYWAWLPFMIYFLVGNFYFY